MSTSLHTLCILWCWWPRRDLIWNMTGIRRNRTNSNQCLDLHLPRIRIRAWERQPCFGHSFTELKIRESVRNDFASETDCVFPIFSINSRIHYTMQAWMFTSKLLFKHESGSQNGSLVCCLSIQESRLPRRRERWESESCQVRRNVPNWRNGMRKVYLHRKSPSVPLEFRKTPYVDEQAYWARFEKWSIP